MNSFSAQSSSSSLKHRPHNKMVASGIGVFVMSIGLSACSDSAPETPASIPTTDNTVSEQAEVAAKPEPVASTADVFWDSLKTLCGNRYLGQLTIGTEESDRDFGYADLIMHAKRCKKNEIDIGLSVDEDDSRTWMIRRTKEGFSLHHRHLHKDGKEDETSGYGGYTASEGSPSRQEFPADEQTGISIPAAATNVWAIEIEPNQMFAYELQRIEQQRMFRVVFDLTTTLN